MSDVRAVAERRYDKGERRFKHVSSSDHPTIEFDGRDPQRWIGKCPKGLDARAEEILAGAIPALKGDRKVPFDKKLYAVHAGVVYEAQTTDRGRSYHGYPYRGRLPARIIAALRSMADGDGCLDAFEDWVKRHVVPHGGGT